MAAETWKWAMDSAENKPELRLEGAIASESWWGDEVTPKKFRDDLAKKGGGRDIVLWINSPGGDIYAGSAMYTALKEYSGHIEGKIDGIAFSAASVVAMAADELSMAPTATMMIHNPWTFAIGDAREMEHTAAYLKEVADGVIAAYVSKTGIPPEEIQGMMDEETYMSANKAVELGFADKVLYGQGGGNQSPSYSFGMKAVFNLARQPLALQGGADAEQEERQRILAENREFIENLG